MTIAKDQIIRWICCAAIIAGAIGLLLVAVHVAGIVIPWWASTIFWIVVVVALVVAAVKFLGSLI
jgi:hypothetical protein